jgi:hypothetical protein
MTSSDKALIVKRRKLGRAMPKDVHLMPVRGRTTFLCGEKDGTFIRVKEAWYLTKFLKEGGTLCPSCQKLYTESLQ